MSLSDCCINYVDSVDVRNNKPLCEIRYRRGRGLPRSSRVKLSSELSLSLK
ncbi:hypothetical protein CEXT_708931, partial [Caerostris extrusa]